MPQCLELGAADARLGGVGDECHRGAVGIEPRQQPLDVIVLSVEHIGVDAERATQQVRLDADLTVGELLGPERLIL